MIRNAVRLMTAILAAIAFGFSVSATAQPGWHFGMGPGMMGDYGAGYGMGPGMMGGYGPGHGMEPSASESYRGLDLSADQRAKIAKIQQDLRTKHWALMGRMMDARYKLQELYDSDKPDSASIDQQYKEIDGLRRQMIEQSIDARNQINAILTDRQREKLSESRRGEGWGPMMRRW